MQEYEWFVSLLRTQDIKIISKHIPGFPSDLLIPKGLKEELLGALLRGQLKSTSRAGRTHSRIRLKELYEKCSKEILAKRSEYKTSFEEILNSKLKTHQKVCLIAQLYPERYLESLPQMMENTSNGSAPFEGLVAELSPIDMIRNEFGLNNELDILLGKLEVVFKEFSKDRYVELSTKVAATNETQFAMMLKGTSLEDQTTALFLFLKEQNRYLNVEFQPLFARIVLNLFSRLEEDTKKRESELKKELRTTNKENEMKGNEIKHLQSLLEESNNLQQKLKKNDSLYHEELVTTKRIISSHQAQLDAQRQELAGLTEELRPLREIHAQLLQQGDFLQYAFFTDESDYLPASFFRFPISKKSELLKLKQPVTFFVNRSAISSSYEWTNLTQLLEKKGCSYIELEGYDELDHIRQVLYFFTQEDSYESLYGTT